MFIFLLHLKLALFWDFWTGYLRLFNPYFFSVVFQIKYVCELKIDSESCFFFLLIIGNSSSLFSIVTTAS